MCTKQLLSVSQVCANDWGKADINLWIYHIMFQIVLYSTKQLHCIVTHTILHYTPCTLFIDTSQHYKKFDFGLGKKSPVLQSQYWAFFANPCITGKIPYYGAANKSASTTWCHYNIKTKPVLQDFFCKFDKSWLIFGSTISE